MQVYALVNSSESVITFINKYFAALHEFPLIALRRPLTLNIIDG